MHFVEKRADGSLALLINGDLQFDSNDERIYHEALTLPALAIAQSRKPSNLRALIIGGGDGLVARELFKSDAVSGVELVDYDLQIVDLARNDLAEINEFSMHDARLTVNINDAWEYVGEAAANNNYFDLIICDLTVPDDATSARFHSIEWYHMLGTILGDRGILAVNAVSPQATPQAFLSIFNSMLVAGLHPRPYHVSLPSFTSRGYGHDWGFLLAATTSIQVSELEKARLAEPRMTIADMQQVRKLFHLPQELFNYQAESAPARAGSSVLLHYFRNSNRLPRYPENFIDTFSLDTASMSAPAADTGNNVLPPELRTALAECIYGDKRGGVDEQKQLVSNVLALMPALQEFHTREIIADFVDRPAAFLQAIDISSLVQKLLQRAAELPAQLVEELKHLSDKLAEWAGDYLSLVRLGERVVTVLTLVVVVGNLVYPDAVYAKGGDHGGDHGGDRNTRADSRGFDRADRGFHGVNDGAWRHGVGYGGYRGYWGHHWGAYGWARPWHGFYWGGYVPPVYVGGGGWGESSTTVTNNNQYVDETGASYAAPAYNYNNVQDYGSGGSSGGGNAQPAPDGGQQQAVYKLADGADLMANGFLAIPVTDGAYLMPTPQGTQVIDQSTGQPVMALANDPALVYQAALEMNRQRQRLLNVLDKNQNGNGNLSPDRLAQVQAHADRLQAALQNLGPIPDNPDSPDEATPLITDGVELFASVWMTPDGKFLAIKRANGKIAYLNGTGWYSDLGRTKLTAPYPAQFKNIAVAFLNKIVSDSDATKNMMAQDQIEGSQHLDLLNRELAEYQADANGQPGDMVSFGSGQIQRSEAIRLTQLAISRTQRKMDQLQNQIGSMPRENELANQELTSLGG